MYSELYGRHSAEPCDTEKTRRQDVKAAVHAQLSEGLPAKGAMLDCAILSTGLLLTAIRGRFFCIASALPCPRLYLSLSTQVF